MNLYSGQVPDQILLMIYNPILPILPDNQKKQFFF